MMKVYPYKMGSASAKALAQGLEVKRIRHYGKPLRPRPLINWGGSRIKRDLKVCTILNHPDAVRRSSNKLQTFQALDGKVGIPEWTTKLEEALKWCDKGGLVVSRTKLTGHSGEGIHIQEHPLSNVVVAPLYTRYIKKKQEYRIHVFRGDAFFVQRKARKKDVPDDQVNWQVRNHKNGFIYANQGVEIPDEARESACIAVDALGLDFGAVDMVLGTDGKYYVLEVNTAPGLFGETLKKYVEKFNQLR